MDRRNIDEENNDNGLGGEPPEPENISPWRDIFFRPRATARWLLANETAGSAQMLWLSFTAFFMVMLFLTFTLYPGKFDQVWSKMQLVMLTPVIFLVSWGYFILQSYLLWSLSRLLGGRTDASAMKIINAYTTVIPSVVFGLISLGLSFVVGRDGIGAKVLENVTMVWAMYISLACLSAAAGISSWRSLVVYLTSLLIWIAGVSAGIGLLKILLPKLPAAF